jgi:hypothetical protein
MTDFVELEERAKRRQQVLRRRRRDPRYLAVVGRFVKERLLVVNFPLEQRGEPVAVGDVLWAGEVEPRLLELVPALIVKRPGLFTSVAPLPDDLARVVAELRRDREPPAFRGIPGRDIHRWLGRVGRRGKVAARLKSFRFTPEDQRLLEHLSKQLGVTETEVLRRALRALV